MPYSENISVRASLRSSIFMRSSRFLTCCHDQNAESRRDFDSFETYIDSGISSVFARSTRHSILTSNWEVAV